MEITKVTDGLARTKKANVRFTKWYNEFTKRFSKPIGLFLKSPTFEQKGVFEAFFATYNYGIYVREHGYDIFVQNPDELDKQTKNAKFLWEAIDVNDTGVDYYWKRHWHETPIGYWNTNEPLRLEYFTIKAIIETMKLINTEKRKE